MDGRLKLPFRVACDQVRERVCCALELASAFTLHLQTKSMRLFSLINAYASQIEPQIETEPCVRCRAVSDGTAEAGRADIGTSHVPNRRKVACAAPHGTRTQQ